MTIEFSWQLFGEMMAERWPNMAALLIIAIFAAIGFAYERRNRSRDDAQVFYAVLALVGFNFALLILVFTISQAIKS